MNMYPCKRIKALWNIKVMVIPIVMGALGTVLKGFIIGEDLEMKGQVETKLQNHKDRPEYIENF